MVSNLVGTRIRACRGQRKWTQQQLADLAGVPRATVATVERDDGNPSLAVVFKIANAFGMTIDQLVESSQRRIRRIPAGEMPQVTSGDGNYRAVTVSPISAYHITQLVFHLSPGGTYEGKPHPPGSEEYLHVLGGVIKLELAGESVRLETGDTAIFNGNVRHLYHNSSNEEGWAVVIILSGMAREMEQPPLTTS